MNFEISKIIGPFNDVDNSKVKQRLSVLQKNRKRRAKTFIPSNGITKLLDKNYKSMTPEIQMQDKGYR